MQPSYLLLAAASVAAAFVAHAAAQDVNSAGLPISPANSTGRAFQPLANYDKCCRTVENIDIQGGDRMALEGSSYGACCLHCRRDAECYAWTWTDYNGGTCWLKISYSGKIVFRPGAVSALSMEECPGRLYLTLDDCDVPGNDIGSARASYDSLCFPMCSQRSDCNAYTWTDYEGGTCWFKSAMTACNPSPNKKSAILF